MSYSYDDASLRPPMSSQKTPRNSRVLSLNLSKSSATPSPSPSNSSQRTLTESERLEALQLAAREGASTGLDTASGGDKRQTRARAGASTQAQQTIPPARDIIQQPLQSPAPEHEEPPQSPFFSGGDLDGETRDDDSIHSGSDTYELAARSTFTQEKSMSCHFTCAIVC